MLWLKQSDFYLINRFNKELKNKLKHNTRLDFLSVTSDSTMLLYFKNNKHLLFAIKPPINFIGKKDASYRIRRFFQYTAYRQYQTLSKKKNDSATLENIIQYQENNTQKKLDNYLNHMDLPVNLLIIDNGLPKDYKYNAKKSRLKTIETERHQRCLHKLNLLFVEIVCHAIIKAKNVVELVSEKDYHGAILSFESNIKQTISFLKELKILIFDLLDDSKFNFQEYLLIEKSCFLEAYIKLFRFLVTETKNSFLKIANLSNNKKIEFDPEDLLCRIIKLETNLLNVDINMKKNFVNVFKSNIESINHLLFKPETTRPYTDVVLSVLINNSKYKLDFHNSMVYLYLNHTRCFYGLSSSTILLLFKNLQAQNLNNHIISWIFYVSRKQISEEIFIVIFNSLKNLGLRRLKVDNMKYNSTLTKDINLKYIKLTDQIHAANIGPFNSIITESDLNLKEKYIKMTNIRNENLRKLIIIKNSSKLSLNDITKTLIFFLYQSGNMVSIHTLNAYLNSYLSTLHPLSLIKGSPGLWFYYYKKFNQEPNVVSWTIIINNLINRNQLHFAYEIFDMMKLKRGYFPLNSNIIDSKNFRLFTIANFKITSLTKNKNIPADSKNTNLEKISANSSLIEKNHTNTKKNLYTLITGFGINPYSARNNRKKFVLQLPLPNFVTYGTIIRSFADNNDIGNAFLLFEEMLSKKILPSYKLITSCVSLLCNNGKLYDAITLWETYKNFNDRCDLNLEYIENLDLNICVGDAALENGCTKNDLKKYAKKYDFTLAQHVASKLITSCINENINLEEYHKLSRHFDFSKEILIIDDFNFCKLEIALNMAKMFYLMHPKIFYGQTGAKIFNRILKYSITLHTTIFNKENYSLPRDVGLLSEKNLSSTGKNALPEPKAKIIENYIEKSLFIRSSMNIILDVNTFSILLLQLTELAKISKFNLEFETALVNFYGINSEYYTFKKSIFCSYENKQNNFNSENKSILKSEAITFNDCFVEKDTNGTCNYFFKNLKKNLKSSKLDQNLEIRYAYAILAYYTVYYMEQANLGMNWNVLVKSLPPMLLLGINSSILNNKWLKIINHTAESDNFTRFKNLMAEDLNVPENLDLKTTDNNTIYECDCTKKVPLGNNNNEIRPIIIKQLIDSGTNWGSKSLVVNWISENLGSQYLNEIDYA
ncbi:hypothetical protein BB561_001986 [Smittium simulii]|uniref:Pentatricopeptide repeat-containing protein n=1 Tax=Smittium simulii TaxID=133385 RepID=A0A2T9YS32_9FUNG|nr:hypothetical protein BB561_001986 [Smittium simulii]